MKGKLVFFYYKKEGSSTMWVRLVEEFCSEGNVSPVNLGEENCIMKAIDAISSGWTVEIYPEGQRYEPIGHC